MYHQIEVKWNETWGSVFMMVQKQFLPKGRYIGLADSVMLQRIDHEKSLRMSVAFGQDVTTVDIKPSLWQFDYLLQDEHTWSYLFQMDVTTLPWSDPYESEVEWMPGKERISIDFSDSMPKNELDFLKSIQWYEDLKPNHWLVHNAIGAQQIFDKLGLRARTGTIGWNFPVVLKLVEYENGYQFQHTDYVPSTSVVDQRNYQIDKSLTNADYTKLTFSLVDKVQEFFSPWLDKSRMDKVRPQKNCGNCAKRGRDSHLGSFVEKCPTCGNMRLDEAETINLSIGEQRTFQILLKRASFMFGHSQFMVYNKSNRPELKDGKIVDWIPPNKL